MEIELFSIFYIIGMIIAIIGGVIRVWNWISSFSISESYKNIIDIVKSAFSTLFSKKIRNIIKGLFLGIFTKAKLRSSSISSGFFKVVFIIAYLLLIIAYHIKVEHIPQLKDLPSYISFFIAPFTDFYFLRIASIESFTITDAFYAFIHDLFALIIISYLLFMIYKRVSGKVHIKINFDDIFCDLIIILWFISKLMAVASTIIAFNLHPSIAKYWFFGYALSIMLKALNLPWLTLYHILWNISGLFLGVLIASIPFTKLWHIIIGPIQILRRYSIEEKPMIISFGKKLTKPFDLRKLLETGSFEVKIGIKSVKDMSWRQRISLEPCIRCGRCQDSCPAFAAGRELSPMEVVLNLSSSFKRIFISDILNFMARIAKWGNFKNYTSIFERSEKILLLNGKLKNETVWSCTTCGACVAICPVDISNFESLIERRRFLVAENKLDSIKMDILRNFIEKYNPYGMPISDRDLWMKGLDVKTLKENPSAEYLYWIGCSSSYDKRNQSIAKSMVNILNKAGVNFAILGLEEKCCGDTLRRMGDEGRFQELALANIEILNSYNVKKIITHCPHCYNTIKNEYKEFGGDFEVIHHSEFLLNLLEMGKIKLIKVIEEETLYHDPCYLGRYNGIYDAPRRLLRMIPNLKFKEFERYGVNSFCCGGGGGNVWYEVPEREKMGVLRVKEAEKIGANLISVACPYCITMLEDALKTKGLESKIKIKDIAETLSELIEE